MVFQFYGVFSLKGGENNKLIILEGEAAQLDVASRKRKKFILSPMFYHLKMGTLSFRFLEQSNAGRKQLAFSNWVIEENSIKRFTRM